MKNFSKLIFAVSMGLVPLAANAMPLGLVNDGAMPDYSLVAQGCGPGGHRGPYGGCRPLFNCPRGFHTGPYGVHCVRNRRFY